MNEHEKAAAGALRRALYKVRDAGLSLRVYDGHAFVVPESHMGVYSSRESPMDICEKYGLDVTPPGLNADGGAGV